MHHRTERSQTVASAPSGAAPTAGPQTVGGGTDYIAQVAGSMSSATGTFPVFSCTSSPGCQVTETGSFGHMGPGGPQSPNIFSLQLNTNFGITTSLCPTTSTNCGGVLQFIYSSQDNSINVQPALAGFGPGTCPTGFGNQAGNCYRQVCRPPRCRRADRRRPEQRQLHRQRAGGGGHRGPHRRGHGHRGRRCQPPRRGRAVDPSCSSGCSAMPAAARPCSVRIRRLWPRPLRIPAPTPPRPASTERSPWRRTT